MHFAKGLCPCLFDESSDDETSSARSPSQQPLLSRPTPRNSMPPRRTYGSKRTTAARGAAAIFGTSNSRSSVTSSQIARAPSPIADLAGAFAGIGLADHDSGKEDEEESDSETLSPDSSEYGDESETENENSDSAIPSPAAPPSPPEISPFLAADLAPLTEAYEIDRGILLRPQPWSNILPPDSTSELTKIAEASYAEVYRITTTPDPSSSTPIQTSILKILHLALPYDPTSLGCPTAIPISTVISEIRIMNALTSVPGFVTFKEAHLVQGKPTIAYTKAYEQWETQDKNYSNFPHPTKYSDRSFFLVVELGDAGSVLEEYEITSIDEVWDIFLGVVMALARAESSNEFEHRDLHENNICLRKLRPSRPASSPRKRANALKYGYSGLEITIIDYGLSRAKLENGTVVFNDLEYDLAVFQGKGTGVAAMQFDCYRRMRSYLLTGQKRSKSLAWHNTPIHKLIIPFEVSHPPAPVESSLWSTHIPYTSVLWLRFLLYYLHTHFKAFAMNQPSYSSPPALHLRKFEEETKELKRRLDLRTKTENGAFTCAEEVLSYVFEMGWIGEGDLGAEESSRLSSRKEDEGEMSILGV